MSITNVVSSPESRIPSPGSKDVVVAFSGGLDTSFCVPWLQERGYSVHTVFADTGGVDAEEREFIEQRAKELGVTSHVTVDGGPAIWSGFVKPFIWAGEAYQGQYPLLVSDRYLIVEAALKRCDELGTKIIAHGCTGMGNDQVRFDLAVKALGDYEIIAPIREIQKEHTEVRAYEQKYLEQRGFGVRSKQQAYTINENVLGLTMSGGEIDRWQAPGEGASGWCKPRSEWPTEKLSVKIGFENGEAKTLDGVAMPGHLMLIKLNHLFAEYGVGRGIYTGDTTIGLKGRIIFEAPGLTALLVAHRALEETVLSKLQNRFKSDIAKKWIELVYEGFYHDPLKADLESFLASNQAKVNGEVVIETNGAQVTAVSISSKHILNAKGATYAQAADWGVAEAEGFIKLYGMSSTLWAEINRGAELMLSRVLEHLDALVSFDTRNPPRAIGADGIFDYLCEALPGFRIELSDHGAGAVSLLAVRGETSRVFNVHLDTVPDSPAWTASPHRLRVTADKAIGLGACDIKGAAACLLTAAENTQGPAAFLFTTDEEANDARCIAAFLSRNKEYGFKEAIVAEPTMAQAVLAHRGIVSTRMLFKGQAGHASDVNALELSAVHQAMRWGDKALNHVQSLQHLRFGGLTGFRFNIGRVEGGIKANMIAPSAEVRFGFRPLPSQDFEELHQTFRSFTSEKVLAEYEETFRGACLPAGDIASAENRRLEARDLADSLGLDIGNAVDFWTEAALFSEAGMTSLVYGPGDIAQAHTADEWVALDQLATVVSKYQEIMELK